MDSTPTRGRLGPVFALALITAASSPGCASLQGLPDPQDPWEGFNRRVFSFNQTVDRAFIKPLAETYQLLTPEVVDRSVTNFFSNLNDVVVVGNDLLQFKVEQAISDLGRIVANSTFGVLGLFDVATTLGMEKHNEDFGQTLGYWGADTGPYLVLPLLGPANVRDTFGWAGDIALSPLTYVESPERGWLLALRVVDIRADLLSVTRIAETAALDEYVFVRDAYLQRRRYLVYDGNPPPTPADEE
jgi:phospholipid-binding lipoprotein MlaA